MGEARPPRAIQSVADTTGLGLGGSHALTARQPGLRVAVVGCGYWGSKHVRVLDATEGVAQVVLVDSRAERLQKLARGYRTALGHTDLQSALDHVDAVVVATPPSTHVTV